jgi:predicted Zn-dependent protease with MMP-like domain
VRRSERERFDRLFEEELDALPESIRDLLDQAPVVLEDRPSRRLLEEMGLDPELDDLCGLHSGVPLTERSVNDSGVMPDVIHLFREGIVDEAGGWEEDEDEEGAFGGEEAVRREIRITLLHEIGHHFGLDEDDLERLGYG